MHFHCVVDMVPILRRASLTLRLPCSLQAVHCFSIPSCHLSTTRSLLDNRKPQFSEPGHERQRSPSSGQPASDYAKEDESTTSGVTEKPDQAGSPCESSLNLHELAGLIFRSAQLASIPTPKLFSLCNRTIIVTGGGRGLGLTVVQALLESGASVAALDLLPNPSQPVWNDSLSLAKSKSLELTYHSLDVTQVDQVASTFSEIFNSTPSDQPVRGLFCAAGIQLLMPALDFTPEQFRNVLDVNVTGTFLCAQAFAREFISRNTVERGKPSPGMKEESVLAGQVGGSIVMTGSMSGTVANLGLECTAYNASKAGVIQMGRNMAMEWGNKGIRVNVSLARSLVLRYKPADCS